MLKRSRFDVAPEMPTSITYNNAATLRKRCKQGKEDTQCKHTQVSNHSVEDVSQQTTLWLGDLERWEDETHIYNFLCELLPPECAVAGVKIVRDPWSSYHMGYGFVDFITHATAAQALDICRNSTRPGHNRKFKINWAATNTHRNHTQADNSIVGQKPKNSMNNFSEDNLTLHVSCLEKTVNEPLLLTILQSIGYQSVVSVTVASTQWGVSRGFGFIRFSSFIERDDAFIRLQGFPINGCRLQVSLAHNPALQQGTQYLTAQKLASSLSQFREGYGLAAQNNITLHKTNIMQHTQSCTDLKKLNLSPSQITSVVRDSSSQHCFLSHPFIKKSLEQKMFNEDFLKMHQTTKTLQGIETSFFCLAHKNNLNGTQCSGDCFLKKMEYSNNQIIKNEYASQLRGTDLKETPFFNYFFIGDPFGCIFPNQFSINRIPQLSSSTVF